MSQKKTKKQPKKNFVKNKYKQLEEVFGELHSDLEYLQYIIKCNEPEEVKEDMLFSLYACLSNRAQKISRVMWY